MVLVVITETLRCANEITTNQCCDLETMVSRLECTQVHFVKVSVSVSRPDGQGLSLGLET